MVKNIVIVESPTKAKTISQFLGDDFIVESSYGHVRDLPKSTLGIDVEQNFEPKYLVPRAKSKAVNKLKKDIKGADSIILATDGDREGEAIAWHLIHALGLDDNKSVNIQRIVFHEITDSAIKQALKDPREININLVDAQQARRILDRLVGYKLSPFLWKKVANRLSAGRVQSVAVRLIVDRENEIRKFKSEKYFTIATLLQRNGEDQFSADLYKINDKPLPKPGIRRVEQVNDIVSGLQNSNFKVVNVDKKDINRTAPKPFITSTLQRTASSRLHFSAKQTMMVAQQLYEKGLITYMRTDSLNLSSESLTRARSWIKQKLGDKYLLEYARKFKTKSKTAQEAHEAIRPTNPEVHPDELRLQDKEKKLYNLIWRRFIASQLPGAVFERTTIEVESSCDKNTYLLRSSGQSLKFDGFLSIWKSKYEEVLLPSVNEGEKLICSKVKSDEHETQPPARYNEASLIKELEKHEIGRPSTYAPIISVIQARNYAYKDEQRRFKPTKIGEIVNSVLTEHFPDIVDIDFTAELEQDLDKIAAGKVEWQSVIANFYDPFNDNLMKKYEEVKKQDIVGEDEETDEACDKCGKKMIIKTSRFGKFLGCSGFPDCKNTKSLKDATENLGKCPRCSVGDVVERRTKKGKVFYGCSRYPECDEASWQKPENGN